MLSKMAMQISTAFSQRGIFQADDIPVYAYGFELLIPAALDIIAAVIISAVAQHPLAWLYFLLPFIPIRTMAGGYHAKTQRGCFLVFIVAYTMLLAAAIYIPWFYIRFIPFLLAVLSFAILFALAPIEASSKPITSEQRLRNRRKSLAISGVCVILSATSFFVGEAYLFATVFFALGQFAAALSLMVAWAIDRRNQCGLNL